MSDLRSDREDTPSTDGEPSSSRYTSKLGRHCHLPPSPARGRNSATYPTSQPIFTGMKGVWTRGPYYVLSQDFPLVVKAIDYANRHWTLPAELEDLTLYVLAALEVSEHPSWPSHWLFWGDATREATKARCKQALGESRGVCVESDCLIHISRRQTVYCLLQRSYNRRPYSISLPHIVVAQRDQG